VGATPRTSEHAAGTPSAAPWGALAWALTGVIVVASLVVRIVNRGPYYPGFDLSGVANGLYVISTRASFADALAYVLRQSREYGAPFPHYSVLAALVPGYLTAMWPWEYWADVVTFAIVVASGVLLLLATRLPLRHGWVLLLAWGASPALLSFSITGFAWTSAFLPLAMALWITLDPRLRRRPLVTIALCLLTNELTWHVYEFGRTAFLVFALAALVLRDVPVTHRAIWLAAAALQAWGVFTSPSHHVGSFEVMALPDLATLGRGLRLVGDRLFVTPYLDVPLLLVAGLATCLAPSRMRMFLLVLLLSQVGLLVLLAVFAPNAAQLRPRRYLTVDFYAIALVASFWRDAVTTSTYRGLRGVVLALLVAGNVWQLADLARFVRAPIPRDPNIDFGFTLPYTHSPGDYLVRLGDVDWARELYDRVERGERLLLVYNLSVHDESVTNPEAILERLYVRLGHRRFVDSVLVFGSKSCRHTCLPIRPMDEVGPTLDALRAAPERLGSITGYVVEKHPYDDPEFAPERSQIMGELARRFTVVMESPPNAKFARFRLTPRQDGAAGSS
jgi:hypothetical protein